MSDKMSRMEFVIWSLEFYFDIWKERKDRVDGYEDY